MSQRFHIIITGENGRSSSFQIAKNRLRTAAILSLVLLLSVGVFGYFTTGSYLSNKLLTKKVDKLEDRLAQSMRQNSEYRKQLELIQEKNEEHLASLQEEHEAQLNSQKMVFDLENTNLQLENIRLMTTAVKDLNQRSELIESVMSTIGVEIKADAGSKISENPAASSGGPFIPDNEASYDALVKKADEYLKAIRQMPLGKPVSASVSSPYGKRSDPVNKKKAIHEGVDLRGDRGQKVYATASGKVLRAFKNGGYGNYVEIDHGNGYRTVYAHLQNYLVKKGEEVKQGQIIGQVGNTGRSTGPHLHYEILLNNKPINPKKFMKVADISHVISTPQP